ncbi:MULTISPECIES: ubiquitin-like small modifier protein 1 [Halolamina]|uniref:MoaD family protein n=1 Tax=Halolamina pelagica TaxID=699431 RepID=A0A1I5V300_9EURY|nr:MULTISPECIES: ubiquitin-like small modifier protein 1 [Halolamina]NHX37876.1 MoaD/ThiS family protein [Halolamina sp. R1-12]SFQ01893.1 MoaD family protein [Halolamina pelagica]
MQVECKLFGPFRDDAGVEDVGGEYDPGTTVGEVLRELEAEYPSLAGRIVDEEAGETEGATVVTINEKNVKHLDGLETELGEGDTVRIVPSVYGG